MATVDNARADIAELRNEMQVGFARIDARFSAMDARFMTLEKSLEATIERRTADLMKWSFGFWIGAVVTVAVLAKLID